jgi:hypothetical protein
MKVSQDNRYPFISNTIPMDFTDVNSFLGFNLIWSKFNNEEEFFENI